MFNLLFPTLFYFVFFLFKEEPHQVHYMGYQKLEVEHRTISPDSLNDLSKFYKVDTNLVHIFYKIQSEFNKPLQISWGYRDPKTNREAGGAKNSAHLQGKAIDISLPESNREDIKKLIRLATKFGVLGIGVYKDAKIFHIDIDVSKGRRAWGSNYSSSSIPSWAKQDVNNHLSADTTKFVKLEAIKVEELSPKVEAKVVVKKQEVKVSTKIYHTIKKGDTLYSLSKKNGTTVEDICKLNKINNPSSIKLGQKIRLK
jgi:LysM repeat protein